MSDTYKVVINSCYGGFGLSEKATDLLYSKFPDMFELYEGYEGRVSKYLKYDITRHDSRLIDAIEELGIKESSGDCAKLVIENIYNPVYKISDYDGYEELHTIDMDAGWTVIKDKT